IAGQSLGSYALVFGRAARLAGSLGFGLRLSFEDRSFGGVDWTQIRHSEACEFVVGQRKVGHICATPARPLAEQRGSQLDRLFELRTRERHIAKGIVGHAKLGVVLTSDPSVDEEVGDEPRFVAWCRAGGPDGPLDDGAVLTAAR